MQLAGMSCSLTWMRCIASPTDMWSSSADLSEAPKQASTCSHAHRLGPAQSFLTTLRNLPFTASSMTQPPSAFPSEHERHVLLSLDQQDCGLLRPRPGSWLRADSGHLLRNGLDEGLQGVDGHGAGHHGQQPGRRLGQHAGQDALPVVCLHVLRRKPPLAQSLKYELKQGGSSL